jgi:hypothetical protein
LRDEISGTTGSQNGVLQDIVLHCATKTQIGCDEHAQSGPSSRARYNTYEFHVVGSPLLDGGTGDDRDRWARVGLGSEGLHYYRFGIGEMTGLKGETFSSAIIRRIQRRVVSF